MPRPTRPVTGGARSERPGSNHRAAESTGIWFSSVRPSTLRKVFPKRVPSDGRNPHHGDRDQLAAGPNLLATEQIARSVAQLTAGQEQMTREITKLQAVEQYVLYKNSYFALGELRCGHETAK
jgi:hypothetical protein